MTKKPCIQCAKDCDIFPAQLGDFFTLTYLRICSSECMFLVACDYLYEIGKHKNFRNKLYELQNEEDKKERDKLFGEVTEKFLDNFEKRLQDNPNILSRPVPQGVLEMFSKCPQIPLRSGSTGVMRFTRPSKEDKIKWQRKYVEGLRESLKEAEKDLEKIENERTK